MIDESETQTTASRALAISSKAAQCGFDWNCPEDVLDKLVEEIGEIREALHNHDTIDHICEEVGDLYFALVNFNRKMQIDSDSAFLRGVTKFERRYQALEALIHQSGRQTSDLSQDELELVWQQVKQGERNGR